MSKSALTLCVLFAVTIPVFAQYDTIIFDPLNGQTMQGKVVETGSANVPASFTPEGWTPGYGDGNNNHILYELEENVEEGFIQFQVRGMHASKAKHGSDNAFCGMYDGRGIEEPTQYFNNFKQNYFRWNTHWRQNRAAMKSVISCSRNSEDRHNSSLAVFHTCSDLDCRDFSEEPTGNGLEWDSTTWHTIRVEWRYKKFKVMVDGVTKWNVTGEYPYAPVDHKIWLGSAPGYDLKYTATIPGLYYRNFVVAQYELSSNAEIAKLWIADTAYSAFDAHLSVQTIYLDTSILEVPRLTAEPAQGGAKVTIVPASKIGGSITERTTEILVKAEDSLFTKRYRIRFDYIKPVAPAIPTSVPIKTGMSNGIYPNPVKDIGFFHDQLKISSYTMYDVSGKEQLLSGKTRPQDTFGSFSIGKLERGTYILLAINPFGESYRWKVVKE